MSSTPLPECRSGRLDARVATGRRGFSRSPEGTMSRSWSRLSRGAVVGALTMLTGGCDEGNHSSPTASTTETGVVVRGRVVNFQNKTRGVANILVRGRDEPASAFSARTDPDGGFSLVLPDGRHVLTAQGGNCRNMNRPLNDPLGTDFRVVVTGGRVLEGAQSAGDRAATLPTMFMDCAPLPRGTPPPTVTPLPTVRIARTPLLSGTFDVSRTGSTDQPLTVRYSIRGSPDLVGCTIMFPSATSVTLPRGVASQIVFVGSSRGNPRLTEVTVTLEQSDDYVIESPGGATNRTFC
jgi:hypothetical protein